MGDWWIDDAPPVGPKRTKTFEELIEEFNAAMAAPFRAIFPILSDVSNGEGYFKTEGVLHSALVDEANKIREAAQQIRPMAECSDETDEALKKRLTGKGIVPHCGPRSSTTFGRRGRKNY